MNVGDTLEKIEPGFVAALAIDRVVDAQRRSERRGHVYVFDSLMHDEEVSLLKKTYGDSLIMLAIQEPETSRRTKLETDFRHEGIKESEMEATVSL